MEGKYQYLITVQFYFSFILNDRNLHDETPVLRPKISKTLFGPVHFSVFIYEKHHVIIL
jgi:hypothetical protein